MALFRRFDSAWSAISVLVLTATACAAPPGSAESGRAGQAASTGSPAGETSAPRRRPPPPPGANGAGTCGENANANVDTTDLDPFLVDRMKASGAEGMAVAVVAGGKVQWTKGYGLANVEENRPATPDTVFMLASVSKTVTATAMMSLIQDASRHLSLDDDVSKHLPFSVRNPNFPDVPITFRMLLTHTSTLIDSDAYNSLPQAQGDSKIPLLNFERDYVAQGDSWSADEPGSSYSYSNTGAALVGLLVEQISGQNLQPFSKAVIFGPLGMPESSWFLAGLDPSHIAMPYDHGEPQGFFGYPDYPDGQLRTSANQLSRFLLMLAGKGACGSRRVLAASTIEEMETPQVPDIEDGQGLILQRKDIGGTTVIGHNGADHGVSTEMYFDPDSGAGFLALTNGSANMDGNPDEYGALDEIDAKLLELAQSLR